MHTVMWSEAEFKPISMAQLLDPDKVKLYYRKAMLVDSKSRIDL